MNKYDNVIIKNLRKGFDGRVYAELRTFEGELLIATTLDCIVTAIFERKTQEI